MVNNGPFCSWLRGRLTAAHSRRGEPGRCLRWVSCLSCGTVYHPIFSSRMARRIVSCCTFDHTRYPRATQALRFRGNSSEGPGSESSFSRPVTERQTWDGPANCVHQMLKYSLLPSIFSLLIVGHLRCPARACLAMVATTKVHWAL